MLVGTIQEPQDASIEESTDGVTLTGLTPENESYVIDVIVEETELTKEQVSPSVHFAAIHRVPWTVAFIKESSAEKLKATLDLNEDSGVKVDIEGAAIPRTAQTYGPGH